MVRIVIIGAGDISRKRHIPGIQQSPDGELYGFCGRNPERTKAMADQYQVRCYTSLQQVWEDEQVDAVLIATPPETHADLTIQALEAGKHVLVEKPMCQSVEEAERMKDAAIKSGKKLMVAHVQRFYDPHRTAKELLEAGEIGKLLSCRTYLGNADRELLEGILKPAWQDSLFNIGIHRIDLLRYLIGAGPEGVFCHRSKLLIKTAGGSQDETDDHAAGILQFDNGVVATFIASRTSYHGEDRSTVLIGTEGTIMTYAEGHDLVVKKSSGEVRYYDFPSAHAQNVLELTDIHERFCRCILDDTEPEVTVTDGLESMKIALAMAQAAREGRWITLE